jgi:hypothetical protein
VEGGFGLEDQSPEVKEGISEVEEEREGTREASTGKGKTGIQIDGGVRGKP